MFVLNKCVKQFYNKTSRKVLGKLLIFFSAHLGESNIDIRSAWHHVFYNHLLPTEKCLIKSLMGLYQHHDFLTFSNDVLNLQSPYSFRDRPILDVYDDLLRTPEDARREEKTLQKRCNMFWNTLFHGYSTNHHREQQHNQSVLNVYDIIKHYHPDPDQINYDCYNLQALDQLGRRQYNLISEWNEDGSIHLHFESYKLMEWKKIAEKLKQTIQLAIECELNHVRLD